jgi:hypothetical protein
MHLDPTEIGGPAFQDCLGVLQLQTDTGAIGDSRHELVFGSVTD